MTDIISIYAPGNWDWCDSYGLIACQLARHLHRLGVHVNAMALGNRNVDNQPIDVDYIAHQPIKAAIGGIALGYPTTYGRYGNLLMAGRPKIALTMFESSKIPPDWVPILNKFDLVVVPSKFCQEVFEECGVRCPIVRIPLGVSETYKLRGSRPERPLTFLTFMDRGKRKGGLLSLRAFIRAFGEDTNYKLILKGRKSKHPIEILNPNIEVIQEDYTEQQLQKLYQRCDVLINPHLGEGFGLIPREFAATGGITLTTPWSGTADDLQVWGWGFPYKLVKADWTGIQRFDGLDLGYWAQPVLEGIVDMLQEVADNFHYYQKSAMLKAASIRRLYSWERFGREVLKVWRHQIGYSYTTR